MLVFFKMTGIIIFYCLLFLYTDAGDRQSENNLLMTAVNSLLVRRPSRKYNQSDKF